MKIVTLDWRGFGDFSAVGQLTKKIFSFGEGYSVHPIQCIDDMHCNVFDVSKDGKLEPVFNWKVKHDAVLHHVRTLAPSILYIRLSPHVPTLELGCKLATTLPHVPVIVHYMDQPSLKGMSPTRAAYIQQMYDMLVRRATRVYTIHESSVPWLQEAYGCQPEVLANFVQEEATPNLQLGELMKRPLKIHYFGSIDRKMNADAIAKVCKVVSNLEWVSFSIWSNSGVWGDVKDISDSSSNISVAPSNLPEKEFQAKMKEADLLLLPYNSDDESRAFLKHSFSNKFVDYLEVGGVILCYGSTEIPTVKSCADSGLALVCEDEDSLKKLFSSRTALLAQLQTLNLKDYSKKVKEISVSQQKKVKDFFATLAACSSKADNKAQINSDTVWVENEVNQKMLSFLIRQKFFDLAQPSQKQSLAASLMSRIMLARGYRGFDYEV